MNSKSSMRAAKVFCEGHPVIVAAFSYLLIALVFTYPLIVNIGSELPQGRGDVYQAMANIDSRVAAASALALPGKILFFVKNIGVHLPYVILNLFLNKYVSYNLLFLSSFVLSGLGAYLLAFHFTRNRYAAFLAGLIYAFSPFHFYQSTVVNLGTMHQEWIPFLALALFRFFEKLEFRYFALVSVFAFLIAMNEHQMLAFSVLFIVMMAAYRIRVDRSILKNRKFWAYVACSLGLLAVVVFGMFGDMLKVAVSDNNFLDAGENAANRYSMKALDPLMPPIFHSLWPKASEALQKAVLGGSNRGSYFIGFSVLAILAYFMNGLRKKKVTEVGDGEYRRNILFWGVSTLSFYVFSLGNSFSVGSFTVYLPYYLVYRFLPFYENIRTTGRMFVFVMLGISILFAYGFSWLLKAYPRKKAMLTGMFAAVILLEFWAAPIPTMTVSYSPFYDRIARESGRYALLEIPGSTSYEFASYAMMTDAVHGKPALNGMPLARKISGQFDMQQETPIIKQLLYTIPKGNDPQAKDMSDILKGFDWSQADDILNYHHVGYVTVSKKYADSKVRRLTEEFMSSFVTHDDRYEDGYLVAYRIAKKEPVGFYSRLDNGDGRFSDSSKNPDGSLQREMGDGARLEVVNMEAAPKAVTIAVRAQASSDLSLGLSGSEKTYAVGRSSSGYSFDVTLAPGVNSFGFSVRDTDGKPVAVREKKKDPKRALVVDWITVAGR